jgi:hypothetical protein
MYSGAVSTTNIAVLTLQFMNYSNTTTFKTMLARGSAADSTSGQAVSAWANLWRSTSAINQIRVNPGTQTWAIGSTFTLYGVKSA